MVASHLPVPFDPQGLVALIYLYAGKLTLRERLTALIDPESFQEIDGLAVSAIYEGDKLVAQCGNNGVAKLAV
jgi:hypothetical protein